MATKGYLRPRHRNDITRIIETEFVPLSPATRLPEEKYRSKEGGLLLQPHQRRILNHAFTPVKQPGSRAMRLPYETFIYSCPKKSGKTAILSGLFYALSRTIGGQQYAMANSREQSRDRAYSRVHTFADWMRTNDPEKHEDTFDKVESDRIIFKNPYGFLQTVPVAPGSQAGGFQSVTGWDELWSYEHQPALRLFAEMQPIPTIPPVTIPQGFIHGGKVIEGASMRIITTYAGTLGSAALLWDIYSRVCKPSTDLQEEQGTKIEGLEDLPVYISDDKSTLCYWDHEARMPWHTKAFLARAKNDPINRMLPEEYVRLWENRWTSGNEAFLDMALIDEANARAEAKNLVNAYP